MFASKSEVMTEQLGVSQSSLSSVSDQAFNIRQYCGFLFFIFHHISPSDLPDTSDGKYVSC
jgi:hypothetical protein